MTELESVALRWYARRNPDSRGLWCVMDADTPPTPANPPLIDAVGEMYARHVVDLHNAWITRNNPYTNGHHRIRPRDFWELAAMDPPRVPCTACGRAYTATRSGVLRAHTVDGTQDGERCNGSRTPVPHGTSHTHVTIDPAWDVKPGVIPGGVLVLAFTDDDGAARATIELRGDLPSAAATASGVSRAAGWLAAMTRKVVDGE